jgi:hypothetical protein
LLPPLALLQVELLPVCSPSSGLRFQCTDGIFVDGAGQPALLQ